MSTINAPMVAGIPEANRAEVHGDNYLTHTGGFLSWALTLDHKRIALMYMVGILGSFLLGGLFALALRLELIGPGCSSTATRRRLGISTTTCSPFTVP